MRWRTTFYQSAPPPPGTWEWQWSPDQQLWVNLPGPRIDPFGDNWTATFETIPGEGYIRAKARDTLGNESNWSNVITVPEADASGILFALILLAAFVRKKINKFI